VSVHKRGFARRDDSRLARPYDEKLAPKHGRVVPLLPDRRGRRVEPMPKIGRIEIVESPREPSEEQRGI
jgi:hypothetical protein